MDARTPRARRRVRIMLEEGMTELTEGGWGGGRNGHRKRRRSDSSRSAAETRGGVTVQASLVSQKTSEESSGGGGGRHRRSPDNAGRAYRRRPFCGGPEASTDQDVAHGSAACDPWVLSTQPARQNRRGKRRRTHVQPPGQPRLPPRQRRALLLRWRFAPAKACTPRQGGACCWQRARALQRRLRVTASTRALTVTLRALRAARRAPLSGAGPTPRW